MERLQTLAVVLALTTCLGVAQADARPSAASSRSDGVCVVVDPLFQVGCGSGAAAAAAAPAAEEPSGPRAAAEQLPETGARRTSTVPSYDPRRLAVIARRGTSRKTMETLFDRVGVTLELSIPQIRAYLVGVEPSRRAAALAQLQAAPSVDNADREPLAEALDSSPNDSDWPQQVGLRVTGFPQAWDLTRGSARVVVAVVDTGVDPSHPDLRGALVPGYDFVNSDSLANDDHGHGTAVAGIIAARTDNHQGLAGACWSCLIMPIKVLDATGTGDDTTIAAGVVWAVDHGARVVNLSLGGPASSPQLADALAYATKKGTVVVAAAGNAGTTVPFYPAADPNAISVAATTAVDRPYSWSNYGTWVNVAAPGCNIAPVLNGGYASFCGTSSSAPVVAGLASLAASIVPTATSTDIKYAVEHASVLLPPGTVQYGRINALQTLLLLRRATLPSPAQRSRSVFRGMLDARRPSRSFAIDVGEGQLTATLAFTGAHRLWLTVTGVGEPAPTWRVAGPSPLRLDRALRAGSVRVVVRGGSKKTTFRLEVTRVRPGER
jgi:subtilisin family serine protease